MAFTFHARVWKLIGGASRATVARIQVLPGPVNVGGQGFLESTDVPIVDGELEVELPLLPAGYRYRLTMPQLGPEWWEFTGEDPGTRWLSYYEPYVPVNPGGVGPYVATIDLDVDGQPWVDTAGGAYSIFLDTDGEPYIAVGPGGLEVYLDTDGSFYVPALA